MSQLDGVDLQDPGLRFWLSHVEHSGGLVEPVSGGALVILPQELQVQLGLPETVTVTGDPEVAREDGALLLAAGHPVLEMSAEQVLGVGDVGRHALVWPKPELPRASDLLEQARDTFVVDHGRIDLAAPPIRSYLPVIRAGAMIRYSVAGEEAFQERLECWLDADLRRELPAVHREALESAHPSAPDSTQVLPFDLRSAVEAAHRLLSRRADARLATLDDEGAKVRGVEIARTKAYYREVLDGIQRRRANTAAHSACAGPACSPRRVARLASTAACSTGPCSAAASSISSHSRSRSSCRMWPLPGAGQAVMRIL